MERTGRTYINSESNHFPALLWLFYKEKQSFRYEMSRHGLLSDVSKQIKQTDSVRAAFKDATTL